MRRSKLNFTALFVAGAAFLTACIDDPEPQPLFVDSDVFVQKIVQEGEEKYALSLWAYGNKDIQEAIVEGPNEETWELSSDPNYSHIFSLAPATEDYSDSIPAPGDYTFKITSTQEGESPVTSIDKLEDAELAAIVIDSTEYTNNKLKVNWGIVPNADAYVLKLLDDDERVLFFSPSLAGKKSTYSFRTSDADWTNLGIKAETGKPYKIELMGILFDSPS